MDRVVTLHELLPPLGDQCHVTDDDIMRYEEALDTFIAGDWESSLQILDSQLSHDSAGRSLAQIIRESPPASDSEWDGVIVFAGK